MPLTTPAIGLQLWINLPKKNKMCNPRYQEMKADKVASALSPDGKTKVKVIAGESYGSKSSVETAIGLHYLDVEMSEGAVFEHSIPTGFTSFIYTLSGEALFGKSQEVGKPHCTLVLEKEGNHLVVETKDKPAKFVLIAGEPIGEPIFQHGPFVMNTEMEIREAIRDYQLGYISV
jgi:quercetin 2,3-dioxygenase